MAREPDKQTDRAGRAVAHPGGQPLPATWPAAALPPGTRVRVGKDPHWDGPWQAEFFGTVDPIGAPERVDHPLREPGELSYWVRFDEPQVDCDGDGPYRMAQIWGRYLQPVQPAQPAQPAQDLQQ